MLKDIFEMTMSFATLIFLACVVAFCAHSVYDCFYP
jgi:hypothetical protein